MSTASFPIRPYTETLSNLFTDQFEFVIPGYQRPYEWSEKQVETAFESIKDYYEKDDFCVFGTIQLNRLNDKKYEIIDGQQRMITFWLFLTALGACGDRIRFSPENEVNKKFEQDLENINHSEYSFANFTYQKNYQIIRKLISGLEDADRPKLNEFILNKIVFVVVETDWENSAIDSTEKTIQIFNALNTTGLPLDTKDLFKIKFRDHITAKTGAANVFERINSAYGKITECDEEKKPYYLSEEDLLSVFKFWLIGKSDGEIAASKLKQSIPSFFTELFSAKTPNPAMSLETLEAIADTMVKTQRILSEFDKKPYSDPAELARLCAKELLSWSGYGHLKNMVYVFVFAQTQNGDVSEDHVEKALQLTSLLWKMCSLFHASVGQIINDVFKHIGNIIVKPVVTEGSIDLDRYENEIKTYISGHWRLQNGEFDSVLFGDIFNNTRKDFFLELSYLDDSKGETAYSVKSQLFYYEKRTLDVEHILSKRFGEEDPLRNQIGNLMYLEQKINRSIGRKTRNIGTKTKSGSVTDDTDDIKQKREKYKGSTLNSVRCFHEKIKERPDEQIRGVIEERNTEKKQMLRKCYESIYTFKM